LEEGLEVRLRLTVYKIIVLQATESCSHVMWQGIQEGVPFGNDLFHLLHGTSFIRTLLHRLRRRVIWRRRRTLPGRGQLLLQRLALTSNNGIEPLSNIIQGTVGIVTPELFLFHRPQPIEHVLQTRHRLALLIQHAALHKRA
jgi:hypothetical protein